MPPKKGKVIIKKNIKSNESKNKKKLVSHTESSIRSADYDNIDRDDYENTNLSDESIDTDKDEIAEEATEEVVGEEAVEEAVEEEPEEEAVEEEVEEEAEEEEAEEEADDDCLYKKAKVKNFDADDNEELELVYDDDNIIFDEIVKPDDRITKPFMTIFERVRLLGDRAKQLSLGAKPMIKGLETINPKDVAKLELEKGVMPLIIERVLPNGKKERWYTHELKIIN